MRCPECYSVFLEEKQTRDQHVKVDACPRCGGIWFDRGELHEVLDAAEKKLRVPKDAAVSKRQCPHCRRPMRVFDYPQTFVKVDVCEHCGGIWLDQGEFKELSTVRQFKAKHSGQPQSQSAMRQAGETVRSQGVKSALISFIDSAIDSMIHV